MLNSTRYFLFLLFLFMFAFSLHAAVITFDQVIQGATSFSFDGDNDGAFDAVFTTTDTNGFNTVGPGPNMNFIQEPGLEGTTTLAEDLRVDFELGGCE